jgi:hypothetical protein
MEQFDQAWEYDPEYGAEYDEAFAQEFSPELDPDVDPEVLYLSLISDEERQRFWPETRWSSPVQEDRPDHPKSVGSRPLSDGLGGTCPDPGTLDGPPLLFMDEDAESELRMELRLSELWGRCQRGALPMVEFLELARLVNEVEGVPGTDCVDCTMLKRPSGRGSWALATTGFCRVHLRLRLGEAEIDRTP